MSHQPERKEKDCLNCGTIVAGRYCQSCGQENLVTKESFWSLSKHFIYDIFHFDGKFFETLKYIFTKPGFVARKYAEGRRASFLHPIRMYLFTSAVFFLVFFSLSNVDFFNKNSSLPLTPQERKIKIAQYNQELKSSHADSIPIRGKIFRLSDTTKAVTLSDLGDASVTYGKQKYTTVKQYDSIQHALPSGEKDNWFSRSVNRKFAAINERYHQDKRNFFKVLVEAFLHKIPYLLFISLPFFALILKLLYVRRKNFYYSDHVIFTLFHYIFSFIFLLAFFLVNELDDKLHWSFLRILNIVLIFSGGVYLLLEIKFFYKQGWWKTIFKFLLLNLLGLLLIFILFLLFFFFSILVI